MEQADLLARPIGNRAVRLANGGYQKPRERILVNFHPLGGGEQWGVHNNSIVNIERALVERVLTVKGGGGQQVIPPQPAPGLVKRRLMTFRKKLVHVTGRTAKLSTSEFVEGYVGRKRRLYQQAADSLDDMPLRKKDAYIQAFIKDEKTNLTRKDDPCPRIIQPRSPRFNVAIGKHLRPMEHAIFRGIGRVFRSTTVMKGLNASERGKQMSRKWHRFQQPVALMLDASRFDQHCSYDIISWEHSVEEAIAIEREELSQLNRWRRVNKCFARAPGGGFSYSLRGTRMSGDMDTAMGNCLTMCGMMWSFVTDMGVEKFEFANDGDDGVLFVELKDLGVLLEHYSGYFRELGFTMKLEGVAHELEHIEFCQSRPVLAPEGYRVVRDPRVCVGKDSLSLRRTTETGSLLELRNAVGWCGAALAGDMPVFNRYYASMINGDAPIREYTTGMQFLSHGMESRFSEPTPETRASFHKAFDLSPDDQVALESEIERLDTDITSPAVLVDRLSTATFTTLNIE